MLEISPVLAGTYNQPANLNSGTAAAPADTTAEVDPRRYTQWDRSASKVADAEMSFGDFFDMINPLQHIPVISSVYREITGDKINPVARVAGDTMYGMALGPAGALFGAVGAIADSMMEEKTGKDVTGAVYAGLFGEEKEAAGDGATMVASAATTTTTPAPTATPTPTPTEQAAQMLASAAPTTLPTASTQAVANMPTTVNTQGADKALTQMAGIPMARNKLPYGGVLPPRQNYSQQNMAMGIAQMTGVHIGNTVYPTRMVNGARQLPIAVMTPPTDTAPATTTSTAPSTQPVASATPPAPTPDAVIAKTNDQTGPLMSLPAANTTPIPAALADDASIMKALGAYQNTALMGIKPQNPYQSTMSDAAN